MKFLAVVCFFTLFFSAQAFADASLVLTPRFESINGRTPLAERALLREKLSASAGPFAMYLESFAEGEANQEARDQRRLAPDYFLQEAYGEFKVGNLFFRGGKQALRWSEMWVMPSLDVWTARRWNRFLYDPQPEQFEHSGGLSGAYTGEHWSLEGVVMSEVARSKYPQPLPEYVDQQSQDVSGGARLKMDLGGFGVSVVGARSGMRDTAGVAANYAFEHFVPKVEVGRVLDRSAVPILKADDHFVALGVDIFWENWTFQPQANFFDFDDPNYTSPFQSLFYLSGTWQKDRHEFQFQTFGNIISKDAFASVLYGYNWKDWFQTSAFLQYYDGSDGGLFTVYRQVTGHWAAGLRFEFNAGI